MWINGMVWQANSNNWMPMAHSWGANWYITGQGPMYGPFSVKLVTLSTRKALIARDVIPRNMAPGATYTSRLNLWSNIIRCSFHFICSMSAFTTRGSSSCSFPLSIMDNEKSRPNPSMLFYFLFLTPRFFPSKLLASSNLIV